MIAALMIWSAGAGISFACLLGEPEHTVPSALIHSLLWPLEIAYGAAVELISAIVRALR